MSESREDHARYQPITRANFVKKDVYQRLDDDLRESIDVVSRVLPFRTNEYLTGQLIDWDRVPDDPIFQLTFPQRGMLDEEDYYRIRNMVRSGAENKAIEVEANKIRMSLNPHPAGQMTHNVPHVDGEPIPGTQHNYRQTAPYFPSHERPYHA